MALSAVDWVSLMVLAILSAAIAPALIYLALKNDNSDQRIADGAHRATTDASARCRALQGEGRPLGCERHRHHDYWRTGNFCPAVSG